MEGAKEPQRAAFEALTIPHAHGLYGVALRLTGGGEDAQDLVQETFLRAFRTFGNFRPGSDERAWLFTILYSVAKNRQRKRVNAPPTASLEAMNPADDRLPTTRGWGSHRDLVRELEGKTVSEEIVLAFGHLSEMARWLVLLVDVEGMSYEEAAEIVSCPVGTVASNLFRARSKLYGLLTPFARARGFLRGQP